MNTVVDIPVVLDLLKRGRWVQLLYSILKRIDLPCLVEMSKRKFAFYFDMMNILIIFM